jgi:phage terminase large subunit-like protein
LARKAVNRPFTVQHFQAWARELELDNGEPWEVEDSFAAFAKDYLAGIPECWWIVPEGNTKTTSLAGLAGYLLEHRTFANIPWGASARDQAEIGYRQLEGFISRSDRLRPMMRCFDGYRRIVNKETHGRLQIFAADDRHGDGIIPTDAFLDELHRHKDMRLYRTWRGKLLKRGGQLATISTAGEPGSEFEETRERVRKETPLISQQPGFSYHRSDRIAFHEWALEPSADINDMVVVKTANPFSGITVQDLAEKRATPTMTDSHWKRFTCNIAAQLEAELFIDPADWRKCASEVQIPAGAYVCLGADGSRTWDTTVVAWATALDDHIDVDCRVFSVRSEAPHHVLHEGGKVDFTDVEAFLLDLFDKYHPLETAYDPRYLERSMEIVDVRLPTQAVIAVEPQTKHARDAYQALYTAVLEGRLRHRGDPVVAAHLGNCTVDRDERTREIRRLRKIDPRKPIDAVPALALAVWRATLAQPSVYEEREALAI